jgi:hypothetical protein
LRIDGGVRITLGNATLAAGERAVVVRSVDAFVNRYGNGPRIVGEYGTLPEDDHLSNGGEQLVLRDAGGATVLDFTYDDAAPWPTAADGGGNSLVMVNVLADPATWANAASWRASELAGGSPGEGDTLAGDLNNDGLVGLRDLVLLRNNLGISSGATRGQGDLNGDGAVTLADVAVFTTLFGRTGGTVSATAAASVVARAVPRDAVGSVGPAIELRVRRGLTRAAVDTVVDAAVVDATEEILLPGVSGSDAPSGLRASRRGLRTRG